MIFEPNSTPMVWFDSSLTRKQNKATQVGILIEGLYFFIFFHSSFEWGSLTSWLIVKELHQWPGISKFSTLFYSFLQKSLISDSRWNWCFVGFYTWLERDKNKVAMRQSQRVQQIPLCGVVTNLGQPHTHTWNQNWCLMAGNNQWCVVSVLLLTSLLYELVQEAGFACTGVPNHQKLEEEI